MYFGPNQAFRIHEQRLGNCCGINALHSCNCRDPKLLKEALFKLINDHSGSHDIDGPVGMLTYSTISGEQPEMEAALKAMGFEIMATCVNPRTNNHIALWGLVINDG